MYGWGPLKGFQCFVKCNVVFGFFCLVCVCRVRIVVVVVVGLLGAFQFGVMVLWICGNLCIVGIAVVLDLWSLLFVRLVCACCKLCLCMLVSLFVVLCWVLCCD